MEPETPSEKVSSNTVCAEPPSGTISWLYGILLLTNRFLVWDIVRVLVLAVVAMYVLVAMGGLIIERQLIILPPVAFVVTLGIMLGLFVITGLLLGNRIGAQFAVDSQGVTYEAHKRERVVELRGRSRALQGLHCSPELFDAVVAAVNAYTGRQGDGGR